MFAGLWAVGNAFLFLCQLPELAQLSHGCGTLISSKLSWIASFQNSLGPKYPSLSSIEFFSYKTITILFLIEKIYYILYDAALAVEALSSFPLGSFLSPFRFAGNAADREK